MFRFLARPVTRFIGDTGGMLSIETAMMAPLLAFVMALMFTTFDIFRFDATNSKAAYTLGDLLSRETKPVDQPFVDGLKSIFDYITLSDPTKTWIRVSVVRYDGDDAEMKLVWSHGSNGVTGLTQETLDVIRSQIPDMSEEDTVVVIETSMAYPMTLPVAMPNFSYKNTVVTRPRFAAQLLWQS